MNKLARFVSMLIKWARLQRVNMFRSHWAAYVGHLEDEDDIESRYYYLGLGFLLNTVWLIVSAISLVGIVKKFHWLEDPWFATVMFVKFYPKEIRKTQTVAWFWYSLEAVLGVGYELFRAQRAPSFMRIYTPRGLAALGKEDNQHKFMRFQRYCMKVAYASTFNFYFFVVITIISYGYVECYSISPTFYGLWAVFILFQPITAAYITVTVPFLLIMSAYYLQLKQEALIKKTKMILKKPGRNQILMLKSFEHIVTRYASNSRLLNEFNQFWSFYLYIWIQIYPIMITYIIYALIHNNIQEFTWITLYMVTITLFATNLLVVVYVCSKVSKKNRQIAKNITYIFRHNLQAALAGDIRRHIHLQGAFDNIRLSKDFFRSISQSIIDNQTFFLLIFKFAFIYMKLTNLAKSSFKSSDS